MMQRLSRYLKLHYAFRYNLLTERTECARLNTEVVDDSHHLIYTPVDNRTLNGIALGAMEEGVDCWDRDIKRYVESDHVQAYHPFDLYFRNLPDWDGKDRVEELARRVSDKDVWIRSFHRWMLAVTAQWTGTGDRGRRANSVATGQQRGPAPRQHHAGPGQVHLLPDAAAQGFARLFYGKLRPDQCLVGGEQAGFLRLNQFG